MKKAILLMAILFLLGKKGFSQENDRNGFASINLGMSIPTGNFGSKDFDNTYAGFAMAGSVFDISFGHKIRPNLGVTLTWRGQANWLDIGSYAQGLADFLGKGNPPGTTSVIVESSSYSLGGIMVGMYGSFPIANKLSFEPRTLIGFSSATLPAMTTEVYHSGTKTVTFIDEQATSISFSYLIGMGTKFDVSKKICLFGNIDFYVANATWEDVQMISIGHMTGNTYIEEFDRHQNFSSVNISLGFGFRF